MPKPTTANEFVEFMNQIWEIHSRPAIDGSVSVWQSPLYDEYQDAITTAKRFGASRTGGSAINGELAHVYRFPADHNCAAVLITANGNACKVSHRRYGKKPRKIVS